MREEDREEGKRKKGSGRRRLEWVRVELSRVTAKSDERRGERVTEEKKEKGRGRKDERGEEEEKVTVT